MKVAMIPRFAALCSLVLLMVSCSSESTVLTPTFRFFIPFGEGRGALGTASVTNDRMPLIGSFVVNDDRLGMFDRETGRLLVYSTDGKLLIDRILEKLESKKAWPAPVLALSSSSVWIAKPEGAAEKRVYRVYTVPDDTTEMTTAVVFPATPAAILGKNAEAVEHIILERLIPLDNESLIAVWHGLTSRGSGEVVSAMAISIADLKSRTVRTHLVDIDGVKKHESGDARFDSIVSVHQYKDTRQFILEAQYRKTDLRSPFEKVLFIQDIEKQTLTKVELPWSAWNALFGVGRDGGLFFIEDVLIHNAATRAIISVYRMDSSRETRYAIEADPARPSLGNFVFSLEGSLYGYEAFDRGVNIYSWR